MPQQLTGQNSNPGLAGSQTQALNHYEMQRSHMEAEDGPPWSPQARLYVRQKQLRITVNGGLLAHGLSREPTKRNRKGPAIRSLRRAAGFSGKEKEAVPGLSGGYTGKGLLLTPLWAHRGQPGGSASGSLSLGFKQKTRAGPPAKPSAQMQVRPAVPAARPPRGCHRLFPITALAEHGNIYAACRDQPGGAGGISVGRGGKKHISFILAI